MRRSWAVAVEIVTPDSTDTIERFSYITLNDASIAISGDVLTQTNADGSTIVSTFNITGQPFSSTVATYSASSRFVSEIFNTTGGVYFDFTEPVTVAMFETCAP